MHISWRNKIGKDTRKNISKRFHCFLIAIQVTRWFFNGVRKGETQYPMFKGIWKICNFLVLPKIRSLGWFDLSARCYQYQHSTQFNRWRSAKQSVCIKCLLLQCFRCISANIALHSLVGPLTSPLYVEQITGLIFPRRTFAVCQLLLL